MHCAVASNLAIYFVDISSGLPVLHRFKDVLDGLELVLVVKLLNVVSFNALTEGEGRQYVLVDHLIAPTPIRALVDLFNCLFVHVSNLLEHVHSRWSTICDGDICRGEVERWAVEKLDLALLNGFTQLSVELYSVDSPALAFGLSSGLDFF